MSRRHREAVQKQFAKTLQTFAKLAVRDTPEVIEEKVQFARPQATDLALDVACGPGTFVLALARRVRFARGTDLTVEMLRQARVFQAEQGVTNACFDAGDAEQLPYPDATFDLVTCQCSFHQENPISFGQRPPRMSSSAAPAQTSGAINELPAVHPNSATKIGFVGAIATSRA